MKRTVLCIQSVALDEQQALPPNKCQHLTKPETTAACNREVLCLALWVTGNWSKVRVTLQNYRNLELSEAWQEFVGFLIARWG